MRRTARLQTCSTCIPLDIDPTTKKCFATAQDHQQLAEKKHTKGSKPRRARRGDSSIKTVLHFLPPSKSIRAASGGECIGTNDRKPSTRRMAGIQTCHVARWPNSETTRGQEKPTVQMVHKSDGPLSAQEPNIFKSHSVGWKEAQHVTYALLALRVASLWSALRSQFCHTPTTRSDGGLAVPWIKRPVTATTFDPKRHS